MNIPLAWECGELRLGKERAEEKINDSRCGAHWTPSIYNPTTSVHTEGEKPEIDQTRPVEENQELAHLYASLLPQIMFLWSSPPPCTKMKTPS